MTPSGEALIQRVTDGKDPALAVFRERKDGPLRLRAQMLVDSDRVVMRALKKGHRLVALLATEAFYARLQAEMPACVRGVRVYLAPKEVMGTIVGHHLHHGVVALMHRPCDHDPSQWGPRLLLFNGVNNSENIGVMVRTAHALGFTGVLADDRACSPYVRRGIRVSMGSVFSLAIAHGGSMVREIASLKRQGFAIIGTGLSSQAIPLPKAPSFEKLALVFGTEGHGLCPEVARSCDLMVKIPMVADIDSLNVGVASGIIMHHFRLKEEAIGPEISRPEAVSHLCETLS